MGNWVLYYDLVRDYEDIIMTPNSMCPTNKELNYVIWKADYDDDEDNDEDSSEEREIYLEKFYSRYNH